MSSSDRAAFLKSVGAGAAALALSPTGLVAAPIRTMPEMLGPNKNNNRSIFDAISAVPDLSTLTQLYTNTPGMQNLISNKGPFTIFCPTNEAFASLPAGQMKRLENRPKLATKLLTYILLPGAYRIGDLKSGQYNSLEGDQLRIRKEEGFADVTVNRSRIIVPNIHCTNGYVYFITKVLTYVLGEPN